MSVKSAERVMKILEMLVDYPNGLTSKEIGQKLELPQSSTFNLLETLADSKYLMRDSLKKYRLGAKLIPIGTSAMDALDIHGIGIPYLRELMNRIEETVFMAVLSDDELVYIAKIDSNRSIRTTAQPGNRKPLYCTGLGKVILSFLPYGERERILGKTRLTAFTDHTITDQKTLEAQLDRYQSLGYSIDDEESEKGLYCLAAPVFGMDNQLIAAISVAGPKERVQSIADTIATELMSTAFRISEDMGYRKSES